MNAVKLVLYVPGDTDVARVLHGDAPFDVFPGLDRRDGGKRICVDVNIGDGIDGQDTGGFVVIGSLLLKVCFVEGIDFGGDDVVPLGE